MGAGLHLICDNCGYNKPIHMGVGMLYVELYDEYVRRVESGRYGNHIRQLLASNENAFVSCEKYAYQCACCNHISNDVSLDVFFPDKTPQGEKALWLFNIKRDEIAYRVKKRVHHCRKCGGKMKLLTDDTKHITCPYCGADLQKRGIILWD